MTSPADLPLDRDVACMRCGYNLRTRRPGETCPECNTSVTESIAHEALASKIFRRPRGIALALGTFTIFMVLRLLMGMFLVMILFRFMSSTAAMRMQTLSYIGLSFLSLISVAILAAAEWGDVQRRRRAMLLILLFAAASIPFSAIGFAISLLYDPMGPPLPAALRMALQVNSYCYAAMFIALMLAWGYYFWMLALDLQKKWLGWIGATAAASFVLSRLIILGVQIFLAFPSSGRLPTYFSIAYGTSAAVEGFAILGLLLYTAIATYHLLRRRDTA